jgi:hypothetical protein
MRQASVVNWKLCDGKSNIEQENDAINYLHLVKNALQIILQLKSTFN